MTGVFNQIEAFHTRLCAPLERGETWVKVPDEALQFLSSLTLCRPAQLVITDGVNREVVEWEVVNGQLIVNRAQGGTEQHKFPAGSELRFEWTAQNVTYEVQGCP